MAFLTVSGVPCGAPSSVTLPLTGRPWADVQLAAQRVPWSPGDQVQLAIEGGPTYSMTVERLGPSGGFLRARLVAGTGGLSKEIGSRWYQGVAPSQVLKDILSECGETAGEIDLPDAALAAWARPAGPAHEALRALMMRYPDRHWRVTPEGRVTVTVPVWPEHGTEPRVESEDPAQGNWTVGIDATLVPGVHVSLRRAEGEQIGKRVTRVTHMIAETYAYPRNQTQLRTVIGTGDGQDSGVSGLEAAVQRAVRWVDYLALFDAEVLRDHGDHTLDLRPSHPLLPEMTRVRLVQPIPGARVKLKAGGTVLISFQAGDPARPVVLHYGNATLERFELLTGLGQSIVVDDDRGEVSPDDALYANPTITVRDRDGQSIVMTPQLKTVTITGNGVINVNAPLVNLAGGGPAVARVGDQVDPVTYRIISGSSKVRSG
ncbi:hypothetical protein [Deinococcus arenicola]|uniref:Phage tail protein n=1 Tax=Deinococcus arenicola TaxID=2994950 RepID=A0ABU4DWD1_9DEIO|nr:hypothetical protein [Deinococcus sp. ZS9-10]MDV6376364.1 hypothetical protein [Deinococcus sp. ZS9-10]